MYHYVELPRFATFLLQNRLEDISADQLELSRKHSVPLLKYLKHLSDRQLIDLTKESMIELLTHIEENKAADYIRMSLQRWLSDQLAIVGKMEVVAEDITLISYIRRRSFKKWVPDYTSDVQQMMLLNDEIDLFFIGQDTSGINTYINILKESITAKENQLLEAQAIAHLGSFEWNIEKDTSVSTPELRKIFALKDRQPYYAFLKYVHPEDVEKIKDAMTTALTSGTFDCEYRYITPQGEKTLWTLGIVSFIDGKPVLMQGTVQDISERKNIERELTEKTAQLKKSNESLQQFASVASHDLKEPLRKIATYTDLVILTEEGRLSQKSTVNLEKVKDAARRMQQMISDILSYSSIEGEQKEMTNLQAVLDETTEVLDYAIKERKGIVKSDGLPAAFVDAAQIRQLFQNLISNALKFSRQGIPPVIDITHAVKKGKEIDGMDISSEKDYLEIKISDNGIGFEEEYAERIFGLFNRLHSKSTYEGSGLGLSIARRIVDSHNGFISASSKKGEGSTFTITLPLHNTA